MDRREALTEGLCKNQLGIEIAPWSNPIAPKREGWNVLSADIFPTDLLIEKALSDPLQGEAVAVNIEEVDLVGSAQDIHRLAIAAGICGLVHYIISSHNFEHLPDPVRFLQGCEKTLMVGGQLIMAVPDIRGSFDYFKPPSMTTDFLSAYRERREIPPPEAWLHQRLFAGERIVDGSYQAMFFIDSDPKTVRGRREVSDAFDEWVRDIESPPTYYRDIHCWAFLPASFELIMNDLFFVGLTSLRVERIVPSNGGEFFAWLSRGDRAKRDADQFYERREQLLHIIKEEAAFATETGRSLARAYHDLNIKELLIAELHEKLRSAKLASKEHIVPSFSRRIRSVFRKP